MDWLQGLEGIVAAIIMLVTLGLLYAKVLGRITSVESLTNQRLEFLQEQIDNLDKKNEDITKLLLDIQLNLASLSRDVIYIKENTAKIEKRLELK